MAVRRPLGEGMDERLETIVDREGWLIVRDPAGEDRWLATDSAVTAPD